MYATTTEANALEPESCTYLAHVLQLLKPECARAHALQQKPPQGETCSLQPEWPPLAATRKKAHGATD